MSARGVALVIGNGDYRHLPAVPTAIADADAVAKVFAGAGYAVQRHTNVDLKQLLDAEREFVRSTGPSGTVLVYFAGYAVQSNGANYLLGTDFDPRAAGQLDTSAYELSRLQTYFDKRQVGARVFMLEASRAAPALSRAFAVEGLAAPDVRASTGFSFSAAVGRLARQVAPPALDVYTEHLVRLFPRSGPTAEQTLQDVKKAVQAATSGEQVPFLDFNLDPAKPLHFVDPPPPPRETLTTLRDGLEYALIPAGTFYMGCTEGDSLCEPDEYPRHRVSITRDFWMTRHEVTGLGYEKFRIAARLKKRRGPLADPAGKFGRRPVTQVTWAEAQQYCTWLGGRLPTEAEWEYAARGGQEHIYPTGNRLDPKLANHFDSEVSEPVAAGTYPDNAFKLFDMAGNVQEWCFDYYDATYYNSGPASDPRGPESGRERVKRGGSFASKAATLRASARRHWKPDEIDTQTGFRCVVPDPPRKQ